MDPPSFAEIMESPLAFAWALGDLYRGDEFGTHRFSGFHEQLVADASRAVFVSIAIPRGHAKTTLFSHIIPAWHLIRDPRGQERILLASATLGLARENCGKVREILSGEISISGLPPVPLATVFPWAEPVNRADSQGDCSRFNVRGRKGADKSASVYTGSPGSSLAGRRYTRSTLDDIVDEQTSETRDGREAGNDFVLQVEALRYDKTRSPITMISTNWHSGDATDFVAERQGWTQIKYDLYPDNDPRKSRPGELRPTICPDFMSPEEANIEEMRAITSNKYAFFSAQYRLRPTASDDPVFTEESYAFMCQPTLACEMMERFPAILLWDPVASIKAGKRMDRNGIAVVRAIPAGQFPLREHREGRDPGKNIFVPIFTGEIAGTADEALSQVEEWVSRKRWSNLKAVWVEDVAAQIYMVPWAESRGYIEGTRIRGQKIPSTSLPLRIAGLQKAAREGYFVIPGDCEGERLLQKRLLEFPNSDYDDLPAALCLLSYHWERRGSPLEEAGAPVKRSFEDGGPLPRPDPPGVVIF